MHFVVKKFILTVSIGFSDNVILVLAGVPSKWLEETPNISYPHHNYIFLAWLVKVFTLFNSGNFISLNLSLLQIKTTIIIPPTETFNLRVGMERIFVYFLQQLAFFHCFNLLQFLWKRIASLLQRTFYRTNVLFLTHLYIHILF